jgi:hypothetical protein
MAVKFAQYALRAPSDRLAGIVMLYTASSAFMRLLGFEETSEFAKAYNRQATGGGIAFRGLNQSYTADHGVIVPATETLKIFGGTVTTDRQLAKGPRGREFRNGNIATKTTKAGQFFDKACLKGDAEKNPLEFDGLEKRLVNKQVISMGVNGAQLTLPRVDEVLDAVVGTNGGKVLMLNKQLRTKVKQLVLSSAGGAAVADFKGGEIETYNGARLEIVDEDDRELPILGFDETQGSDAETASIYCVRAGSMDGQYLRGLVRQPTGAEPIDYVDYGERDGVYSELVEAVMGIALYHPRCAARLKGVKIPA